MCGMKIRICAVECQDDCDQGETCVGYDAHPTQKEVEALKSADPEARNVIPGWDMRASDILACIVTGGRQ